MSNPIISLEGVSKTYKQLKALKSVSVSFEPGEVIGLFGHNGAGKTTMMKLILGVISPTDGQINVLGKQPDTVDAWESRRDIGYLPENVMFYEQLSGLEVLTYFAKLKGKNKQHAIDLLTQVGIRDAMRRPVKTYSKGMRQRLGLAQAFIGKPKLLLLDEPTVGLDPVATADFYKTVDTLKSEGTTVILCSHVLPGVEKHIDKAIILSKGHIVASGEIEQLRVQANLPVRIKTAGIDNDLQQSDLFKPYIHPTMPHMLNVPETEKMKVLGALFNYESLSDIIVDPADLGQVYQHYLKINQQQLIGEGQ